MYSDEQSPRAFDASPGNSFLIKKAQYVSAGRLFEDPDFPPSPSLLPDSLKEKNVAWRRPFEICQNPEFISEGITQLDVVQGELANCWVLAAITCLTNKSKLMDKVVPAAQSFSDNYAGIFLFRFWQYKDWVEVFVDDRLPTIDGHLILTRSTQKNEFWSALLEKAYAKVNGSFSALHVGFPSEALRDFTGGIVESIPLKPAPATQNLWHMMKHCLNKGALICCGVSGFQGNQNEVGLFCGHAYSVIKVDQVHVNQKVHNLIRIRNPYGQGEYTGCWSDGDECWQSISEEEKRRLGYIDRNEGEFWISEHDFVEQFILVEICNMDPGVLDEDQHTHAWVTSLFESSWKKGVTAGGPKNDGYFTRNPKIIFNLMEEDEESDSDQVGCSFLVLLSQKHRRLNNAKPRPIGFYLYQVQDMNLQMTTEELQRPLFETEFEYRRDVVKRMKCSPGCYIIIPSMNESDAEGDFTLTMYTEKVNNSRMMGRSSTAMPQSPRSSATMGIEQLFKVVVGVEGGAKVDKLQSLLNTLYKPNVSFSLESCRTLLTLCNKDRSGQLNYEEFTKLLATVEMWKNEFIKHDADHSQSINIYELDEVIKNIGFDLGAQILSLLINRYFEPGHCMSFEDFVCCMTKLTVILRFYKSRDMKNQGQIAVTLDELLALHLCS
uniref:calpain-1 catalytic subunit-like isoform X2 n=1 Tax=Myxine glutinosa TaxID=7769 RepID=UPI00358F5955